jgi:hypothetical protein
MAYGPTAAIAPSSLSTIIAPLSVTTTPTGDSPRATSRPSQGTPATARTRRELGRPHAHTPTRTYTQPCTRSTGSWLVVRTHRHARVIHTQDLVIPALRKVDHYSRSPLLRAPPRFRDILLFFRGDVGEANTSSRDKAPRFRLT